MNSANFISPMVAVELLQESNVSFVDGSWYLPAMDRDGRAEYEQMRIPGAVFFDIDEIKDHGTELPHMLPDSEMFAREMSALGISERDLIIVYDGPGLFSSARIWWTFKVMGAEDVRILEGGFDRWKSLNLPVETGHPNPPAAKFFKTSLDPEAVASQQDVIEFLSQKSGSLLDARPQGRFVGKDPEPRPGLRSGHIPDSISLPATRLIENGQLLDPERLEAIFKELGLDTTKEVITSCGSGVTAAILVLALNETGRNNVRLYDGSWAEWGLPDGPDVKTDE